MKIGMIGAGNIGFNAAKLFAEAGHEVALSNSRGPETLQDQVAQLGGGARAMTAEDAASFGELVMEAIPFAAYRDLPVQPVRGKVFISASNYFPGRDGDMEFHGRSETELVARHLEGARVVKAFNTIYYKRLADEGDSTLPMEDRRVIPIAGDDREAKDTVARLIEEIGFAPLDLGSLREGARWMEPGNLLFTNDITLAEARELLEEEGWSR